MYLPYSPSRIPYFFFYRAYLPNQRPYLPSHKPYPPSKRQYCPLKGRIFPLIGRISPFSGRIYPITAVFVLSHAVFLISRPYLPSHKPYSSSQRPYLPSNKQQDGEYSQSPFSGRIRLKNRVPRIRFLKAVVYLKVFLKDGTLNYHCRKLSYLSFFLSLVNEVKPFKIYQINNDVSKKPTFSKPKINNNKK